MPTNAGKSDADMLVQGNDAEMQAAYQQQLTESTEELATLTPESDPLDRAKLLLKKVNALVGIGRKTETWDEAKQAFDLFIQHHHWEEAAECCDVLYQAQKSDSIKALVHGVWLSVSFPVDPELTVVLLNHIVEETPPDSDGAAVAAATAHYVVGIRADDKTFEDLNFLTTNLIAQVAGAHSQVDSQEVLDFWIKKLELDDPAVFLPRLGEVLNYVVKEDEWWFDRDALRAFFPQ